MTGCTLTGINSSSTKFMMMKSFVKKALICFTCSIVSMACYKKRLDEKQQSYHDAVEKNDINSLKVLVIPRAGCGGCISGVTYYVVKNYDRLDTSMAIVFTGVGDLKLLKNQVGADFLNKPNVIIDKDSYFQSSTIVSDYPTLVKLNQQREMQSVVNFDPDDKKLLHEIMKMTPSSL